MTDALIERLRAPANWMREDRSGEDWKSLRGTYDRAPFEAADRISALTAEVARLRSALSKIEDGLGCRPDYGVSGSSDHYCPNCDRSLHNLRDIARAALKGHDHG